MNDFSLYFGRVIICLILTLGLVRGGFAVYDLVIKYKRRCNLFNSACIIKVQKKYKKGCYHGDLTLYCSKCGKLIHVSANEGFINARCCGKQMQCMDKKDVPEPVEPPKIVTQEEVKQEKQAIKKAITTQEIMSKLKKGDKNNA